MTVEQWDLHGWVPGASSVDLLLQSRWTAWPPCRCNQFNVCCIFSLPVASNHPWYSNISTRKEKSWPSLYGAAQRTGETNRKEQQVTFSLSLSSVDLCLCQQIHLRWEVGAGQWNPSQQFGNHIALCCNDKASFNVLHVVKQSFKKKDLIISLL